MFHHQLGHDHRNVPVQTLVTHHGFIDMVCQRLQELQHPFNVVDARVPGFPAPRLDLMHGFRFSQKEMLETALLQNRSGIISATTRYGKCLAPGTGVLMFDGTVKNVEDIKVGDLVMGQDSTPRAVSALVRGVDMMYEVIPNRGSSFTVTRDHKLVLRRTPQGVAFRTGKNGKKRCCRKDAKANEEVLVTPEEFERASKTFRHLHKLVKRPVAFPFRPCAVDHYCYGLWLGDGTTGKPHLTTSDTKCDKAWREEARKHGLKIRKHCKKNNASYTLCMSKGFKSPESYAWMETVKRSSENGLKRILPEYMINSREAQLELLAGMVDSDGYLNTGGKSYGGCYQITTKWKSLSEDITKLCHLLGFRATVRRIHKSAHKKHIGVYYDVTVSTGNETIPVRLKRKRIKPRCRVNILSTGFRVKKKGFGPFFGFEVEGPDKMFLLGDCTVTHNSTLIRNTLRAYAGLKYIVVIAPGVELVNQLYDELVQELPGRAIRKITGSSSNKTLSEDITVTSMDSLDKLDSGLVNLVLVDEPHALPTNSRVPDFVRLSKARKLGFGATLDGRFDDRDPMIVGLIGPVLVSKPYREAVAEGAVSPIKVIMMRMPMHGYQCSDRSAAYRSDLWENTNVADALRVLLQPGGILPSSWQTLMFINNEAQLNMLMERLADLNPVPAMAKLMKNAQRKELAARLRQGQERLCICSNIYAQGITMHDLRVVINLDGGGASTKTIQKPGRVAEVRPDKKAGVVFDFLFEAAPGQYELFPNSECWALTRESKVRMKAYQEVGFDVHVVDNWEQVARVIQPLI